MAPYHKSSHVVFEKTANLFIGLVYTVSCFVNTFLTIIMLSTDLNGLGVLVHLLPSLRI